MINEGNVKIDETLVDEISDYMIYNSDMGCLLDLFLADVDLMINSLVAWQNKNSDIAQKFKTSKSDSLYIYDITSPKFVGGGRYEFPVVDIVFDASGLSDVSTRDGERSYMEKYIQKNSNLDRAALLNQIFKFLYYSSYTRIQVLESIINIVEAKIDNNKRNKTYTKFEILMPFKQASNSLYASIISIKLSNLDSTGNNDAILRSDSSPAKLMALLNKRFDGSRTTGSYREQDSRFQNIQSLEIVARPYHFILDELATGSFAQRPQSKNIFNKLYDKSQEDEQAFEDYINHVVDFTIEKIKQTIRHELIHYYQKLSFLSGNKNFGLPQKNPDRHADPDNYKYHLDDYEFYPWVGEVIKGYELSYEDFTKEDFLEYISDWQFLDTLKVEDFDKYKKAVKIIYTELEKYYDNKKNNGTI